MLLARKFLTALARKEKVSILVISNVRVIKVRRILRTYDH